MVKSFNFAKLPLVFFGKSKIALLPGLIKRYGNSILLVTGRNSFLKSDASEKLSAGLEENGIIYHRVIISGEPSPDVVDKAVKEYGRLPVDVVVSIGGGSAIDAGKAISAMMYKDDPLEVYLEGVGTKDHPGTKVPFIAVPTTSGTGSEATKNAVISRTGKNGFKKSLRHDNLVPDIAVIDPELTLSCTPSVTAASGMDCFTQLTEAYLSDKACEYTDAFALEGLKALKSSLVPAFIHGDDIEARTNMSFAALTSGICLANAGLGVVHGFASSIGGLFDISHGLVCGTLMASANKVIVNRLRAKSPDNTALKKYVVLGKIFLDEKKRPDSYYIDGFVDYLYDITDQLALPGLKKSGIQENALREIASLTDNKNNPVKLDTDDMTEILSERF